MDPKNNCLFSFLRVVDAGVDVLCSAESSQSGGCYASLWLHGERGIPSHDDKARYTIELRALNDSVVRYKGMDGNGYSVCCSMITGNASKCDWLPRENIDAKTVTAVEDSHQRRDLVPSFCVLENDEAEGEALSGESVPSEPVFRGEVLKPLHKLIAGSWEATVTFSAKGEAYGRLVVPFVVTPQHIALAAPPSSQDATTSSSEDTSSAAAAAVAVVAVEGGAAA
jgi:hypothetical protein